MQKIERAQMVNEITGPLFLSETPQAENAEFLRLQTAKFYGPDLANELCDLHNDDAAVVFRDMAIYERAIGRFSHEGSLGILSDAASYVDRFPYRGKRHTLVYGRDFVLGTLRQAERYHWQESLYNGGSARASERLYELKVAASREIPRKTRKASIYAPNEIAELFGVIERIGSISARIR